MCECLKCDFYGLLTKYKGKVTKPVPSFVLHKKCVYINSKSSGCIIRKERVENAKLKKQILVRMTMLSCSNMKTAVFPHKKM